MTALRSLWRSADCKPSLRHRARRTTALRRSFRHSLQIRLTTGRVRTRYDLSTIAGYNAWPLTLSQERDKQNKATVIDNWLKSYEQARTDVGKLKNQYLYKVRRADEAEDEYVEHLHSLRRTALF